MRYRGELLIGKQVGFSFYVVAPGVNLPAQIEDTDQQRREHPGIFSQGHSYRLKVEFGNAFQGLASEPGVDIFPEEIQHLGGDGKIHPADLALDHAVGGDDQDHQGLGPEGIMSTPAHRYILRRHGGGNGDTAGGLGQGRSRVFYQLVGIGVLNVKERVNFRLFGGGQGLGLHQVVDVEPVSLVEGTRPAEVWGCSR